MERGNAQWDFLVNLVRLADELKVEKIKTKSFYFHLKLL